MGDEYTQKYNYYNPDGNRVEVNINSDTKPKRDVRKYLPFILLFVAGLILIIILFLLLFNQTPNTGNDCVGDDCLDPDKAVNLQWWGTFLDPDVIQPLLDQYKTIAPNVTIEYANKWSEAPFKDSENDYKTEINRVLTENDSVQLPDIFMINNLWVGDYERYIFPSSNISYSDFTDTYYPVVVSDFGNSSRVYGLPLWLDTYSVIYNKEMLANQSVSTPPTDWSQFRSLAQKLTKKTGSTITQAGFSGGTSENVSYAFELATILMLQNGVDIFNSSGVPSFSTDSDSLTSLNFLKDFENGTNATWNTNFKNDSSEFLEEDLAMLVAPSYRLRDILTYNEGYSIDINIGVSSLPQLTGQEQPIINFGDYWSNVVTLNRPNREYSWAFLKWLNEPEQLKTLSSNIKNKYGYFGILYPRSDMSQELINDEYLKTYNDVLPYVLSSDLVNGTLVREAFIEAFGSGSISQSSITNYEEEIISIIANKGRLQSETN